MEAYYVILIVFILLGFTTLFLTLLCVCFYLLGNNNYDNNYDNNYNDNYNDNLLYNELYDV